MKNTPLTLDRINEKNILHLFAKKIIFIKKEP